VKNFKAGDFVVIVDVPRDGAGMIGRVGSLMEIGGIGYEDDDVAFRAFDTGQHVSLKEHQIRKFVMWWVPYHENMDAQFALEMLIEALRIQKGITFKVNHQEQYVQFRNLTDEEIEARVRAKYSGDDGWRTTIDVFIRMISEGRSRDQLASYWFSVVMASMIWLDK
jgi:hypothetical protein